jgi:hypothetical protein
LTACREEDKLPIALTAEQLALQASIREWAERTGTIRVVRSQEPGAAAAVEVSIVLGLPREEDR